MIASLTGRVAQVGLDHAVINVNGFGMLVYATARTLSKLRTGEEATVLTTMIVREESMTLYGFSEPAEREVFDMMLSVSGIGPVSYTHLTTWTQSFTTALSRSPTT